MTSDPTDDTNGDRDLDNDSMEDYKEKNPTEYYAYFTSKMNTTEIENQFNPFVKENIPPVLFENGMAIESEGHISPTKASWAHVKVKPSDVGGIEKVEVRIKGWMLDYVEIYDDDGDGWYEGKLEISYALHYLLQYTVQVKMTDNSGNVLEFEMEQEGMFAGVVDFVGKLWDAMVGGIVKAWEAVKSAVNVIVEFIKDTATALIKPITDRIQQAIENWVRGLVNKAHDAFSSFLDDDPTNDRIDVLSFLELIFQILYGPLAMIFLAIGVAMVAINILINIFTGGAGTLLSSVAGMIAPLMFTGLSVATTIGGFDNPIMSMVSGAFDSIISFLKDLLFGYSEDIDPLGASFWLSIAGLIVEIFGAAIVWKINKKAASLIRGEYGIQRRYLPAEKQEIIDALGEGFFYVFAFTTIAYVLLILKTSFVMVADMIAGQRFAKIVDGIMLFASLIVEIFAIKSMLKTKGITEIVIEKQIQMIKIVSWSVIGISTGIIILQMPNSLSNLWEGLMP